MFVYRRFGRRWGMCFGLPEFVLLVLPLWVAWAILKATVMVTLIVIRSAYRLVCWAWRRRRRGHPPNSLPDSGLRNPK